MAVHIWTAGLRLEQNKADVSAYFRVNVYSLNNPHPSPPFPCNLLLFAVFKLMTGVEDRRELFIEKPVKYLNRERVAL